MGTSYNYCVLSNGPVGFVFANAIADNSETAYLWHHDPAFISKVKKERRLNVLNTTIPLDQKVIPISGRNEFKKGSWCLLVALSSRTIEETLERLIPALDTNVPQTIAIITKGILSSTQRQKTSLITYGDYVDHLAQKAGHKDLMCAVINGPSLLKEIIEKKRTYFNISCPDPEKIVHLIPEMNQSHIDISLSTDRFSAEIAGACKNPLAVACGMVEALPAAGKNITGELIAQGFAEIARLAVALGAKAEVLLGRSGLADLISTAISPGSRNYSYGYEFVSSALSEKSDPGILERMGMFFNAASYIQEQASKSFSLVEGAYVLGGLLEVAKQKNIEMPIFETLFKILSRKTSPESLLHVLSKGINTAEQRTPIRIPTLKRQFGMRFVKGTNFQNVLVRRVGHIITGTKGRLPRLQKNAGSIVKGLEKRFKDKPDKRERAALPEEIALWQKFAEQTDGDELPVIEDMIRYYVNEISDDFLIGMREFILRSFVIFRSALNGFMPGSMYPGLGGPINEIRKLANRYNVLYVPTHRSHLDSVEVSIALKRASLPFPRYAAGINLMSGPLYSFLLKSLGAYAVDRKRTRNMLYLECLNQYAIYLLESGIPSLVYPEGTRTRTGGILPLKTGLLATAMDSYLNSGREVIIVPIAVSYETVPEDEQFLGANVSLSFTDFIRKRRRVYTDFADPIFISEYTGESDPMAVICDKIQAGWKEYMRIQPNHVLAKLLLDAEGHQATNAELPRTIESLIKANPGNYLTKDTGKIIRKGTKTLKKLKLIKSSGGLITSRNPEALLYYSRLGFG